MTQVAPAKSSSAANSSAEPEQELSTAELADIRAELEVDLETMRVEYQKSLKDLNDLQQHNTDGAGDDQADVGSKTFEREQEQSIANNRQDLVLQIERAITRIDSGSYGRCEDCGQVIPKERLKAIPMATLDARCKARSERR